VSTMGPSGNDPDSGLQPDVGVDLHVWTTRWEQIEEARPEDPQEALADAADLLDEMFAELEVPIGPAEAPQTEDLVKAREQIRDVVDRLNREAPVDREELDDALDEARRTFDLLVSGRMGNGDAAL
jgi:phage gp36-like protein